MKGWKREVGLLLLSLSVLLLPAPECRGEGPEKVAQQGRVTGENITAPGAQETGRLEIRPFGAGRTRYREGFVERPVLDKRIGFIKADKEKGACQAEDAGRESVREGVQAEGGSDQPSGGEVR